jgi:hypothetical protein
MKLKDGTYPSGLSNYYGSADLVIQDGAARLELENWDGPNDVPVTEAFARAWLRQFKPAKVEKAK